ncbi:hypothetical protein GTY65_26385 [Streptomyces sp. SID8379]|uniref:hypothetical protein n=1 Tax=unclassified Streptomyces TaxID=2593676 RepID=UPI00037ACF28|nr:MULTISPECIES: hypothetical protein [unclassified Streptomyces]MYW67571.1 hypothetical protein [Streptomyces sp. SID8379]
MQLIRFEKKNKIQALTVGVIAAGALFASVAGIGEVQAAPSATVSATAAGTSTDTEGGPSPVVTPGNGTDDTQPW